MQNSKIEWCDHTFNPWWGCQKVSPGCEKCYALTLSHRYGHNVWGPAKTTERREMSANYWKQPIKWNDAARKAGQRARVFCASMADVFEDHPQVEVSRRRLFALIGQTPHLDWLLLTKRPENMTRMAPASWGNGWPENIIAMTSVEDQRRADERIPKLLKVPARRRGLSCEPLLEAIDLATWFWSAMTDDRRCAIHWVIAGGESGHGARPMHPDWARSLRDQCAAAGIPYFFKQWGEWKPVPWPMEDGQNLRINAAGWKTESRAAGDRAELEGWPWMCRLGKTRAGRLLDGVEHNAYPE